MIIPPLSLHIQRCSSKSCHTHTHNLVSKLGLYDLDEWTTGQVKNWLDSLGLMVVTGWLVICSLEFSKRREFSERNKNLSRCYSAEDRALLQACFLFQLLWLAFGCVLEPTQENELCFQSLSMTWRRMECTLIKLSDEIKLAEIN